MTKEQILQALEIDAESQGACIGGSRWLQAEGDTLDSICPSDGKVLASVRMAGAEQYDKVMIAASAAFTGWRMVPAPQRGLIVRDIGEALRQHKDLLGSLVALEMGKIKAEGDGEVQEMIDMADFAAGLSRQLYGLTMHSERPQHRMYEQWHPMGVVGIISAFNFPVAVWAWNAFLAAICGNTCIWKPSLQTPLTAVAVQHICNRVSKAHGIQGVFNLVIGSTEAIGERMVSDPTIALLSFTGSTAVGRSIAAKVASRLGKSLLELGGNNAVIVDESARLDLAVRAVLFGAVGTAGQRCTSTRRVLIHQNRYDEFKSLLMAAYRQVRIGNPLDISTHMGPVSNENALKNYRDTIKNAIMQGGTLLHGGKTLSGDGYFVEPAIIECPAVLPVMKEEHFVPVLFISPVASLKEAILINNEVAHGLSSALFTDSLRAAEEFLSHRGSDCGIANINIGTSGAEIGGAFGGEKDTGGGRESGSDAWKAYMRRQTNTINWGEDLPLAQGIQFEL
jgi:aldehyde dehydrogenase (NAD+)